MKTSSLVLALVAAAISLPHSDLMAAGEASKSSLVFIGTYTGQKSQGIYSARFDPATGELSGMRLAAETKNPTFLALSPDNRFLYAVNETSEFEGKPTGSVSAFRVDPNSGELKLLNRQPSAGQGPCHVAVDPSGQTVLLANYGSGSIAAYRLDKDGRLSEPACQIQHHGSSVNRQRQEGPHAHFITAAPSDHFVLACDLGLDQVLLYRLDPAKALLTPAGTANVKPGAGPRHLAFHPNHRWVYVINELDSTITACDWDSSKAALRPRQTLSTLAPDFTGKNSCAEIALHPSGKWVYGSNRGDDSIAVFTVQENGDLTWLARESTRGKTPRHFMIDPSGRWLLAENQDSNDIFVFRIDSQTGKINPVGDRTEVGAPVCLVFVK